MTKQEMLEQMIAQIMEDFDFERVHKVMEFVDWKWMGTDGKGQVKNTFKYNECNELQILINSMKDE